MVGEWKRSEKRRKASSAAKRAECRDPDRWCQYTLRRLKQKCVKLNIPFDLERSDLKLPDTCPVYSVPFVLGDANHPHVPSVDRIRPDLGYVKGNVKIISRRANLIKQDSVDPNELRLIASYMDGCEL